MCSEEIAHLRNNKLLSTPRMSKKKNQHKKKQHRAGSELSEDLSSFSLDEDDDGSISQMDLTHMNRLIGQTAKAFTKSGTEFLELFKKRCSLTVGFALMDFYENMLEDSDQIKRLQAMYLIFRVRELDVPAKKKSAPTLLGHPFATFFFSVLGSPLSSSYSDFSPSIHEKLLSFFILSPNELPQWMEMSAEGFVKLETKRYTAKMTESIDNEITSFYSLQMDRYPSTLDVEGYPSWITVPTVEDTEKKPMDLCAVISSIHCAPTASMIGLPPQWMPILPDFYPVQDLEMPEDMREHVREREEKRRMEMSFLPDITLRADDIQATTEVNPSEALTSDDHVIEPEPSTSGMSDVNHALTSSSTGNSISVSILGSPLKEKSALSPSVFVENVNEEKANELVAKILEGHILSQSESRILVALLAQSLPKHAVALEKLKLIPLSSLPQLIEDNSKVAGEILARNLREDRELVHTYVNIMMTMELSVQCLEIIHKIYKGVPDLDRTALTTYVRHLIRQCQDCQKQSLQVRLVRITAILIATLIKEKYLITKDIYSDAYSMCLQFSGHQATTTLYQFLKVSMEDEEKLDQ